VTAANAFIVQWSGGGSSINLIGGSLVPQVSGGVLTELSGTNLTQISGSWGGFQVILQMMTYSVTEFFDLVQAKDWVGLAGFIHQGNDSIVGDRYNDTLFGGDGNDSFYSHTGRDIINGGAGNDTLEAQGGHDLMTGGRGADTFLFKTEPVPGQDWWVTIKDFRHGSDRIDILDVFDNIGLDGPLGAEHFHIGRAATTADHGIVYNRAKGWLFYDADGAGALEKVLLAKLGAGTVLTVEDIWVV
jgi:Ca2+-binding RTX toxin-like protein